MTNAVLAEHFELLARLMDLHGENSFRTKTYSSAAFSIDRLDVELSSMDTSQIYHQRGVGQAVGDKILELLDTGEMKVIKDYLEATPKGVMDMLGIKGLGPKKVAIIWKELGIEDLGALEYACGENRLAGLKGFGQKTQQKVLEAIQFYTAQQGQHLWASCKPYAESVLATLRNQFPAHNFAFSGAYRRQVPTLTKIEIVTNLDLETFQKVVGKWPGATSSLASETGLLIQVEHQPDLHFTFCSSAQFFTTLFTTTASSIFLEAFLNSYVLLENAESEEAIFIANALAYIPPAQREGDKILVIASKKELPSPITTVDIKGIIHSHSTWSDGANTIEEMALGARDLGYQYLVISDHSQAAQYAGGLLPDSIVAQHAEIDELNKKMAPFKIFKSIEADILGDGSLDYSDKILASFDLVIASVHSNLSMPLDKAMHRLLTAIASPFTTILGHMTGRLLLSRAGYPLDHKAIIAACVKNNVVIEINAHPRRLDMDWEWIEYAIAAGVLLSINPDAHSIAGFSDVYFGVMAAQKGGLTPERNLSSFSLKEFEAFLSQKELFKNL